MNDDYESGSEFVVLCSCRVLQEIKQLTNNPTGNISSRQTNNFACSLDKPQRLREPYFGERKEYM